MVIMDEDFSAGITTSPSCAASSWRSTLHRHGRKPKKDAGKGRFLGRVWIEDQDYNIVRFNGTYYPHPRSSYYLHFDSWR